jgi:hypothetical protein
MKWWFPLVLGVAAAVAGAAGRVEAVRDGVALPAAEVQVLEPLIVRLLESCHVDSTTFASQPLAWTEIPKSGWYIRVRWPQALEIQTHGAGTVRVDEILIALPKGAPPGHLQVKSGDQLRSFTKYAPEVMLAIAQEPVLGLSDLHPYANWAGIDWLARKAQALRDARPEP